MSGSNARGMDRNQRQLLELLKQPGNDRCADCLSRSPRWSAYDHGVFLCVRCAGLHRKLGTHLSKVKSVSLDVWTREQVDHMRNNGNIRVNEALAPGVRAPVEGDTEDRDGELERFIRRKYVEKAFVTSPTTTKEVVPPLPRRPTSSPRQSISRIATPPPSPPRQPTPSAVIPQTSPPKQVRFRASSVPIPDDMPLRPRSGSGSKVRGILRPSSAASMLGLRNEPKELQTIPQYESLRFSPAPPPAQALDEDAFMAMFAPPSSTPSQAPQQQAQFPRDTFASLWDGLDSFSNAQASTSGTPFILPGQAAPPPPAPIQRQQTGWNPAPPPTAQSTRPSFPSQQSQPSSSFLSPFPPANQSSQPQATGSGFVPNSSPFATPRTLSPSFTGNAQPSPFAQQPALNRQPSPFAQPAPSPQSFLAPPTNSFPYNPNPTSPFSTSSASPSLFDTAFDFPLPSSSPQPQLQQQPPAPLKPQRTGFVPSSAFGQQLLQDAEQGRLIPSATGSGGSTFSNGQAGNTPNGAMPNGRQTFAGSPSMFSQNGFGMSDMKNALPPQQQQQQQYNPFLQPQMTGSNPFWNRNH